MTDAVPAAEADYDLSLDWPDDELREDQPRPARAIAQHDEDGPRRDARAREAQSRASARGPEGGGLIQVLSRQLAALEDSVATLRSDAARRPSELEAIVQRSVSSAVRDPSELEAIVQRAVSSAVRDPSELEAIVQRAVSSAVREVAVDADAAARSASRELVDVVRDLQRAAEQEQPAQPLTASMMDELERKVGDAHRDVVDAVAELRDEVAALRRRVPVRAAGSSTKLSDEELTVIVERLAVRLAEIFEVIPDPQQPAPSDLGGPSRRAARPGPLTAQRKA